MPGLNLTANEARDEMYKMLRAAWNANTPALNNGVPIPLVSDNILPNPVPGPAEPWAEMAVRHNLAFQESMGGLGGRRFSRQGVFVCQLYTRLGSGLQLIDAMGTIVVDCFEGKHSPDTFIWFRNVRRVEVGKNPQGMYQVNVLADFEYDEVK